MFSPDCILPIATPYQAFQIAIMGELYRSRDTLRLRVFPLWLARSREGHPFGHYSLQSRRIEGPTPLQRLSTTRRCGSRLVIPSPIYTSRISNQGGVHHILASAVPDCI